MKFKIFKSTLSVLLACILMFGTATIGVSASAVGSEDENIDEYKIFLDISETDWTLDDTVYCHAWNYETGEFYAEWMSNVEKMTISEEYPERFEINISELITDFDIYSSKIYGLIFTTADKGMSYTVVMDGWCYYETVYLSKDTETALAPDDNANQTRYFGEWRGFTRACGTHLAIDNTGRVYGHALFEGETSASILAEYLIFLADKGITPEVETVNTLLDEVQALTADVKNEVAMILDELVSEGTYTQDKADEISDVLNPVLDLSIDPVLANKIYFDVFYSGWDPSTTFFCHVWALDGSGTWPEWQTKAEKCEYDPATGYISYDLNKTGNEFDDSEKILYGVIFSSSDGTQSETLTMNGECIGDEAYCDIDYSYETEVATIPYWMNNSVCGQLERIDSNGEIHGWSLPYGVTDEMVIADYLITYTDSITVEGVQQLIEWLQVTVENVKNAVEAELTDSEEDAEKLQYINEILDGCTDAEYVPLYGDVNYDEVVNVSDATIIQKYCADMSDLYDYIIADVNRDGIVNVNDSTAIQKMIVAI